MPTSTAVRHLDPESRAWLDALDSDGVRQDDAIRRLHALLLREARFEVGRRTIFLRHPSGGDLDDLALQTADDAVVAILGKLGHFRGDSLFTTWARRFAQREAPAKIRRRVGRNRDLPIELDVERSWLWHAPGRSPYELTAGKETVRRLAHLIAHELTTRQRDVLVAVAIDGVATKELADRLRTTPGALYKTLHDARRKLQAHLDALDGDSRWDLDPIVRAPAIGNAGTMPEPTTPPVDERPPERGPTTMIDAADAKPERDRVDEYGAASFPASDPPSWWSGH